MSTKHRNELTHVLNQVKNRLLSLQIQLDYVTDHIDLEMDCASNPYFLITYRYLNEHLPRLQAKFKGINQGDIGSHDHVVLKALQEQVMTFNEILMFNYTPRINTLLAAIKKEKQNLILQ